MESPSSATSKGLTGLVAAVTGPTGGIGRAGSLELAPQGASLVVHGRNAQQVEALANEIRALGREVLSIPAELEQSSSHPKLAADAWSWHGGIDIWINLAGADVLTGEPANWSFEKKL